MTQHPQRCIEVHDAGMGEHEYFVFYDGTYYATTDTRKKAEKIIEMLDATDEDYNVGCASHSTAASGREQVLDKLDAYAEECRYENERRGRSEKNEVIVAALAGAALAFEGMRKEIAELRKRGEQR